jgi:hypothetical protein
MCGRWDLLVAGLVQTRPSRQQVSVQSLPRFVGCAAAAHRQHDAPAPNGPGVVASHQVSYSAAAAATTLVATSRIDESPVVRPDGAASRGLMSRRASKVVPWATGMTRSVASSAEQGSLRAR